MAKEKVTLTLDTDQLTQLRAVTKARSLSAAVDGAITAHLEKWRHLDAIDEWLSEMEREHGPVQPESLEWAARAIDRWEKDRSRRGRRSPRA